MNKIYKVMYSKVKQCAVVVSEIAKSHGHNGESSSVRKHAALTAAVLIALGSLSFTTAFMPMTAEAAITKTKTDGADFVGVERTDGLFDDSDYANHKGQGAHGDDSITVGLKASGGDGTITIGDRRAEQSLGSVYVGRGPGMPTGKVLPDKTDDGYWATSVGYQSDATGYGSIAIGSNATANNSFDKDSTGHGITLRTTSGDGKTVVLNGKPDIQRASVAIGYGASADNGNIAIGSYSDASTDLRTAKTAAYLTDTQADSYVSVGKTDALRRISNVADGAADSDVATVSQLKKAVEATDASKKANIDATNIGKNLKYKADGKTAADSADIKTNEDAWGTAIGTGKVEQNNGQLVTGNTVFNALQEQKNDLTGKLSVTAGWGINIDKANGNTISLNRNLGTNYGNPWKGEGKVTFEAGGENSLILGGAASILFHNEADDVKAGAYGKDSVLVGGFNNLIDTVVNDATQTGEYAVIVGGDTNEVTGQRSVSVGGYKNTVTGSQSVINGGASNIASGATSSVFGGQQNTASGLYASVFGGDQNEASEEWSSAIGGITNKASGIHAVTLGGENNVAEGQKATTVGGTQNMAIGEWSLAAGGAENTSYGDAAYTAGGMHNMAYGNGSVALGGVKSNVNAKASTGIAGGSTGEKAITALAAGYQSVVTDSGVEWHTATQADLDVINQGLPWSGFTYTEDHDPYTTYVLDKISTAVGYQSTADAPGVIAFGHDKGDVASVAKKWKQKATEKDGKYYDANHNEISQDDYYKLANADGTWNDYTQAPIGTEEKTYQSAYYNRLVKAADGIDAHDAVVMEQLKNASDVGSNIKVYKTDENGNVQFDKDNNPIEDTSDSDAVKTKREAAQKASEDAWGSAIGTGKVVDPNAKDKDSNGSGQLVTGGTVYNALQQQKTDLTDALTVKPGWGIEKTDDNTISVKHNLGTNYGNKYKGKGKVTFEADGENSLILGGGALNDSWEDRDKEVTYGAHGKDSILVGGLNNDIAKDSEKVATNIGTKASIGTRAVIIGGTSNTVSYDPVTEKDPDTGKEKVKVDSNGNVIVQTQKTGTDAIIVGGLQNTAKGDGSVLIGGESNEATGFYSTVIGGTSNKTDGWLSSIFGGTKNTITGAPTAAGIFGGTGNTINSNGIAANVFGGENNTADNTLAVVVGGEANTSSGPASIILGGNHNTANQLLATVVGGQLNTATGETSMISGGIGNVTSGAYSYDAGGLYNRATGIASSALGGRSSSVNGMFSTGVAGGSTGQDAFFSLAAGYKSVVADSGVEKTFITGDESEKIQEDIAAGKELSGFYMGDPSDMPELGHTGTLIHYDKFSTALGYQATADEAGTIAFGHDAGDESGYTYEWEQLPKDKDGNQTYANDGTTNDYTKAPKSIKKNAPYTSAYYNRLVKVADGIDDHDVVVMEQLKQYAEKDASNIGNNLIVAPVYQKDDQNNIKLGADSKPLVDEEATQKKLAEAQKANKDAWGLALGAGTLSTADAAKNSDQLITGKTLYNYDKPTTNGTYVNQNQTTGQNLSALDTQVKANTDALTKPNHNIKYYSVTAGPSLGYDQYTNENNDGAKGTASLAAGNVTHTDGAASTVVGSYSAVFGTGLQGAAALSYGTVNVNNNTDTTKKFSGVANSIVGQANMTTNSNAAIIYGAGNTVTDSYRDIDKDKAEAILNSTGNAEQLKNALQDAVPTSGAQVMVMGGGNSVDKAYMTQVTGVGNKVTGQDSTYAEETSTQYNYVDGFQNELTNGKHDYIIGSNNKVSGDSVDNNQSNIVIGDNHKLTNQKNNVIIGSSDKEQEMTASNAVSIGHNAKTGGDAVAIGEKAKALNQGIAVGANASAGYGQNMALGYYASVASGVNNSTALGYGSQITKRDILPTDGNDGVVSVGKAVGQSGEKGITRRIINVKAGVKDTDAVNVSQLKSAQTDLTDKGLTFAANSGTAYKAKLGDTVKIQGTDKKDGHEYTADNLTTEIDGSGNITILMDKNISADKIAVNGKDGKDAVSIAGKDGVGHIGLTGPAGTNGMNGADGKPGTSIDITVKNGYDDTAKGINGTNGVDGKDGITRIVYTDKAGEHQVATMEDGLKFKGDDETVIAKKLNNQLDIIGGADSTKLTEKNIGVNSTTDGKLKVQLAKDLKGITSISNQNTTKVDGKDVTTGAKIDLGEDGSVNVNGGKITNVGSGADASGKYTETTNAANIGDVQTIAENTATSLTGKGLKFATNSGTEYTAKLGSTVKIQGTGKKDGHEYTADNLTTEIDGSGNITILMDKDMSTETLAVNGKDGKDGQPGTAGSIGISGRDGKAGVGIDGKDGISIKGHNGKDGVTIKGIDGVDGVDGAEGHIGLNGKDGMTDIFTTAGKPGLNGKDGETMTRIVYKDPKGTEHEAATLDDGLKFKGDDDTVIAKNLNNTMEIIGGANSENLTDGNIGVNSTKDNQLKVQLAKDLKGITSISNQKTEGDKTTGAKITLGNDGSVDVNGGKITNVDSGADASGNYTTKTNAANIGDVQKIVKDAVDSASDTTTKALAGKANINASNIGANLKGADGKAAATEEEKTKNENAWGSAIGTGKIAKDNGQLVTGKTVYEYNRPIAEDGKKLNYVSEDKTTGQNLGALDSHVKNNADAIQKNSESIQNITNNVQSLSENAVKYEDSSKKKVNLGGEGGTTITNVKDGKLSDDSTEAVNGRQLNAVQKQVTNNTSEITKIKNGDFTDASKTAIHNIAKDAVEVVDGVNTTVKKTEGTAKTPTTYAVNVEGNGKVASGNTGLISGGTLYNEVHVDKDGSYVKSNQTVGQNLSALDSGLKTTSDLIHTNTAGDTIQIGESSTATKIDVHGKDGKDRVITGVVTDAGDPTSAANVGYVNNAYGRLNNNINKAAAGSNALAALHPLDYDPDDKADFAVGYGHYRNANAAALGAFYHPNENTMVNVGVSLGNGDPGFNAGVSFKIGSGSAGRQAMSKTEMAKVINSQSKEIDALKKDNADKDKRIDALEQKMAEILAKLDKNGK